MQEFAAGAKNSDETVKVTRDFLNNHPEEIKTKNPKRKVHSHGETGYTHSIEAFQVAEFLG